MTKITVDIMSRDDLYVCTFKIEPSLSMITDYLENKPVVSVNALCKVIEERRPTLRGKGYKVLPCNDNYLLNYD